MKKYQFAMKYDGTSVEFVDSISLLSHLSLMAMRGLAHIEGMTIRAI